MGGVKLGGTGGLDASLEDRHGGWWAVCIWLPRTTRPKERLLCPKDLECPTELRG